MEELTVEDWKELGIDINKICKISLSLEDTEFMLSCLTNNINEEDKEYKWDLLD